MDATVNPARVTQIFLGASSITFRFHRMCCSIHHTCRFCLPDSVSDCKLQLTVQSSAKQPILRYHYAPHRFSIVAAHTLALTSHLLAGDRPDSADELTKVKSNYADVFALQGTAKGEILAIAKILRAKPRIA